MWITTARTSFHSAGEEMTSIETASSMEGKQMALSVRILNPHQFARHGFTQLQATAICPLDAAHSYKVDMESQDRRLSHQRNFIL